MLSISNIGTAFLALYLSKEVRVDSSGILKSADDANVVATRSIGLTVELTSELDLSNGQQFSCVSLELAAEIWHDAQEWQYDASCAAL